MSPLHVVVESFFGSASGHKAVVPLHLDFSLHLFDSSQFEQHVSSSNWFVELQQGPELGYEH